MQDKAAEITFFDAFGTVAYDVFDERGYERILGEFRHYVSAGGGRALDMGCGTGAFTARLPALGYQVTGIDISPKSISFARQNFPSIQFDIGDIEKTAYADESFDAVFLSGVLHHFPDCTAVLREARRVLKRNGVLLAYDPHRRNPIMWAYRCKDSPFYSSKGVTENEAPVAKQQLEAALSDTGFSQRRVYAISGVTYKYVESTIAKLALPIYNSLERVFDLPMLRDRFGSFLITCARK